jgi:excisionase family DNA binding protein
MTRHHTDPTVPSDQEAMLAREVSRALADREAADAALRIQLVDAAGAITALDLPATATRLLVEVLREMGEGRAVALLPMEIELTTQQAADLLNMSRPFVVGLIESGVLPARMVGNQRRVPLQDVLAYKADNKARRKTALDELTDLDEQSGLR